MMFNDLYIYIYIYKIAIITIVAFISEL